MAGAERDQLLDHLQHLRTMLPAFAQEAASARRQAAQLRVENRRLLKEVHRLQRVCAEPAAFADGPARAGVCAPR